MHGTAILSVGIDIGTTTTQLVFSRIILENTAGYFSAPRVSIIDKDIIYRSRVYLTPLLSGSILDIDRIRDIVAGEFRTAGFTPQDTDTGAVIITGESARKENSRMATDVLSSFAGEFVVSTAGPDLESIIAGKGSGAYQYSLENECSVINLDIGGGTTNIVRFQSGNVTNTCCLDIGGRLIRFDDDGKIIYLSSSARKIASAAGIYPGLGERLSEAELTSITDRMADILLAAAGVSPEDEIASEILTNGSSPLMRRVRAEHICFSGGVADCIFSEGSSEAGNIEFKDIGKHLGASLRRKLSEKPGQSVISARETIRATVIGAGTYTTSLSGSTIYCSNGVLPLKNLPVMKLSERDQEELIRGNTAAFSERLSWFLEQSSSERVLIALPGKKDPTYSETKALAAAVSDNLDKLLQSGIPIVTNVENDMAKALGFAMEAIVKGKRPIVSIDSVDTMENDFVDIGKPLMGGLVVPVIVKTMLFG